MKFDEETWDNVYEVPAELAPVIELLTNQANSRGEALLKIYRAVKRADDESYARWTCDPEQGEILNSLIVEIQALIPEELKPL